VAFGPRNQCAVNKILFVTGTGTGVGKTVLTALLLAHLRGQGRDALAMKPFCSGGRRDARLLHRLQNGRLTIDDVDPFYYDKPVAPAAAPRRVPFRVALARIRALADRCEVLLIEGAGGLLAPLGDDYTARDIVAALPCGILVASRNRLGTINHALLTVEALQDVAKESLAVVLMGVERPDPSASSNAKMLRQRLASAAVFSIPYLGNRAATAGAVKKNAIFLKKELARIF
jgi:dethiobiotin synthetase